MTLNDLQKIVIKCYSYPPTFITRHIDSQLHNSLIPDSYCTRNIDDVNHYTSCRKHHKHACLLYDLDNNENFQYFSISIRSTKAKYFNSVAYRVLLSWIWFRNRTLISDCFFASFNHCNTSGVHLLYVCKEKATQKYHSRCTAAKI